MLGKLITWALIGFYVLSCVSSLLLKKRFVGPGHRLGWMLQAKFHRQEWWVHRWWGRVPGATKSRADHGAEETLCRWNQTVVKTHRAAFRKELAQPYTLFWRVHRRGKVVACLGLKQSNLLPPLHQQKTFALSTFPMFWLLTGVLKSQFLEPWKVLASWEVTVVIDWFRPMLVTVVQVFPMPITTASFITVPGLCGGLLLICQKHNLGRNYGGLMKGICPLIHCFTSWHPFGERTEM